MAGVAATISEWGQSELDRMLAIFQTSAEMVFNDMTEPGGRVPRVTGNLARSAIASDTAMPTLKEGQEAFPDRSGESIGVIHGVTLGATVYIGFQAAYSARVNYGFVGTDSLGRVYNQMGRAFIEAAQQDWPQTVARAEAMVRGRFERA